MIRALHLCLQWRPVYPCNHSFREEFTCVLDWWWSLMVSSSWAVTFFCMLSIWGGQGRTGRVLMHIHERWLTQEFQLELAGDNASVLPSRKIGCSSSNEQCPGTHRCHLWAESEQHSHELLEKKVLISLQFPVPIVSMIYTLRLYTIVFSIQWKQQ